MLTRINGNLPVVIEAVVSVAILVAVVVLTVTHNITGTTAVAMIGGQLATHSVAKAVKGG